MTTLKSDADVLYGGNTPTPTPLRGPTTALTPQGAPATPTPPRSGTISNVDVYGADYEPEPSAPGVRLSDEEVLYPVEGTLAPVFRSRVDDLFLLGLDREAREARHGDFADIIREARVNALVASPLYGGIVDAELAAKRGTPVADSGRLIAHEEQVLTELKTLYGVDGAERLIGKTVAFLAAHPRLKQLFDTPGLGAQDAGRTAMEALIEHVRKL